jgi:cell division protein ZapE
VQLSGQPLTAKNAGPELLWVAFDELCAIDASRSDYLALAEDHGTWVIDGVPSPAVESPRATAVAWQRFSEVVEVLFERDVTLFVVGNGAVGWKSEAADQSAALPGVTDRLAGRLALLPLIESEDDLPDAESAGC